MRKTALLVLTLLGLGILLLVLDRTVGLDPIRGGITWLLAPLQDGIHDGGKTTAGFWEQWRAAERLREENARLKEMVALLTTENRRCQEIAQENADLRQLLGLQERYPELLLLHAEVIGRDPGNTHQVLRIGWAPTEDEANPVREGMVVIAAAGLVGRIIQVYPNAADVLLITDSSSTVSAIIQNEDRSSGIVEGGWQLGYRLRMRFIPQGDLVQEGDWVLTAGLQLPPFVEEAFPPGIPIGRVLKVEISPDMHQQAELLPQVDFDHLERVMIVLGTR